MRIAYDSNIFTMQKYGGVSRYMVRLGEELCALGNEVEVFGLLHKNRYIADSVSLKTRMRYINEFPTRTRRLTHHVGDLVATRQLMKWRPDIIHESFCHNRSIGSSMTPRVCTIHDLIYYKFPEFRGKLNRIPEYQQKTIDRSDAVICVSESTKCDLLEFLHVDPRKIHVVHHGFEHAIGDFTLVPDEERILEDLCSVPYLLYVGGRGGYKNFQGMLDALAASTFARALRVIAFGGPPLKPCEIARIAQLGFKADAVRQSCGSDAMLRALYRRAEAFVYPSIYEGFGFPPLEAMAEGCPVISSNASSMPEVIGDAAEFFDPQSTESMTSALETVIQSEARRNELRQLGVQRIQCFPWSDCAVKTEQIYRSLTTHIN
jgi:glycosyltransferase involved in cell wall biosynthesis